LLSQDLNLEKKKGGGTFFKWIMKWLEQNEKRRPTEETGKKGRACLTWIKCLGQKGGEYYHCVLKLEGGGSKEKCLQGEKTSTAHARRREKRPQQHSTWQKKKNDTVRQMTGLGREAGPREVLVK